ncbi:hypothetical protein FQR65_LT12576 [Abscondita terminalis]|nr:hypothetical protein FQR65_LT12576 [Abscondita terminalis]
MSILWVLLLLTVFKVEAYKNNFGKCAHVDTQPNFDMQKMLGRWFVIDATSTSKSCLTYTFDEKNGYPGSYLLTETYAPSGIAEFFGRRSDYNRIGVLNPLDDNDFAVMTFKKSDEILKYKFIVISTDYDSFALIYACKKMPLGQRRWSAMILSRTSQMKPSTLTKLWTKLAWHRIDIYSMNRIDHEHCKNDVYETVTEKKTTTTIKSETDDSKSFNSTIQASINAIFNIPQTENVGFKEVILETTTVPEISLRVTKNAKYIARDEFIVL